MATGIKQTKDGDRMSTQKATTAFGSGRCWPHLCSAAEPKKDRCPGKPVTTGPSRQRTVTVCPRRSHDCSGQRQVLVCSRPRP